MPVILFIFFCECMTLVQSNGFHKDLIIDCGWVGCFRLAFTHSSRDMSTPHHRAPPSTGMFWETTKNYSYGCCLEASLEACLTHWIKLLDHKTFPISVWRLREQAHTLSRLTFLVTCAHSKIQSSAHKPHICKGTMCTNLHPYPGRSSWNSCRLADFITAFHSMMGDTQR